MADDPKPKGKEQAPPPAAGAVGAGQRYVCHTPCWWQARWWSKGDAWTSDGATKPSPHFAKE